MEEQSRAVPQEAQHVGTAEAARRFNVTKQTIRTWCVAGRVGHRIGSRWRLSPADLEKIAKGWARGSRG
jgi:excisionase family DNA binding protein